MWGEHHQRTVERLCLEYTERWQGITILSWYLYIFVGLLQSSCVCVRARAYFCVYVEMQIQAHIYLHIHVGASLWPVTLWSFLILSPWNRCKEPKLNCGTQCKLSIGHQFNTAFMLKPKFSSVYEESFNFFVATIWSQRCHFELDSFLAPYPLMLKTIGCSRIWTWSFAQNRFKIHLPKRVCIEALA